MQNHKKEYPCNTCTEIFQSDHQQNQHFEIVHRKLKDFNCNDCLYQGHNDATLKKHIDITHHTPSRRSENVLLSFNCNICTFACDSKLALDKHFDVSNHDKITKSLEELNKLEFSCHSCGENLTSKQSLICLVTVKIFWTRKMKFWG